MRALLLALVLLSGCSLAQRQLEGYRQILNPTPAREVCRNAGVTDAELPMCIILVNEGRKNRRY